MHFLDQAPRFLFFTGKGGVGKTSLACATAVQLAGARASACCWSAPIRPPTSGRCSASQIGNHITPCPPCRTCAALEIDPQAAAQAYRDRIVGPVRGVLPDAVVKGIEEQLSGACTTEIAAFDEFTALLTDTALTRRITSTSCSTPRPPATPSACCNCRARGAVFWKRARAMPRAWGRWPGWKSSAASTRPPWRRWPTPPHPAGAGGARPGRHAARGGAHPCRAGRHRPVAAAPGHQRRAARRGRARPAGRRHLPARAGGAGRHARRPARAAAGSHRAQAFNLVGLDALRQLLVPDGAGHRMATPVRCHRAALHQRPACPRWWTRSPQDGHGLVMLMGKGGVGKTTLAAAVAVELATGACRCT
jgi:arsenite-transporting ATPase